MGMRDVVRRRTPRVEKILKGSLASGMEKTGKEGEEFKPIRIDVNQVDPYLAALSRTDFNHVAFATELILHYFQPFVTLFVFDPRVRVLCRNRHFIYGGNIPLTAFQIGIMICLAVVNVIAVVDNRSFSWYQLAIFNISTLLRYIVIAIKYAYMSPIEYAETFTNGNLSPEANERRHLLTGWNTPEESLRDMQLLLSSVRQQCCLLSAHFDIGELDAPSHPVNAEHRGVTAFATMQNDARERFGGYKTEEFVVPQVGSIVVPKGDGIEVGKTSNGLGKIVKTDDAMNTQKPPIFPGDAQQRLPPLFSAQTLPEDPSNFSNDAKVEIPVETEHGKDQSRYVALWDVATGIVDESMSLSLNLNWMFLPGLFHTSIPLLSFFLNTNILTRIDWSPHTITMTFFLHLFVALFGMSVMAKHFGFLMVGISDFRRREYFQRRLSAVMNDGYVRAGGEVVRIPMDRAQNIVAWWYLRACLQDWGLNYFRRISAYTGFFLVYVGLLVVIVLVQSYVVQGTVENSIYA
ncbi:hypothetical protein BC829DRAFT_395492 [Chytridium lagenaria]|nr:hypothetical protein BC829DRAFT_395492 [Chytridium lagenaria]